MAGFIVLIRNPRSGEVMALTSTGGDESRDENPPIAVYDTRGEAEIAAQYQPVCDAWPWNIVEAP